MVSETSVVCANEARTSPAQVSVFPTSVLAPKIRCVLDKECLSKTGKATAAAVAEEAKRLTAKVDILWENKRRQLSQIRSYNVRNFFQLSLQPRCVAIVCPTRCLLLLVLSIIQFDVGRCMALQ